MFTSWFLILLIWCSTSLLLVNCEELCSDCPGIIVDTDCGADDAMAISLLLSAEAKGHVSSWGKVIGITTVTGNTGAANATRNVNALLSILSIKKLPVYQGMEDGLAVHIDPTWYYGYDGLGDFLPPPDPHTLTPSDVNPGFYLASTVHKYPHRITILCIGPLTNLAMALHFNPNFFNEVKHIFILGGDYRGGGNIKPGIEANMYSDPDAAAYFFSKIPSLDSTSVTLLPLETISDLTIPVSFRTNVLGIYNSPLINFLNHAEGLALPKYEVTWPCYDPTAASVLLDEGIIDDEASAWVEVITQGPRGAMFASLFAKNSNVNIVTKVNQERLTNLLDFYLTGRGKHQK